MHRLNLELMDAEYQFLVARRRLERCLPSSPASTAAMHAVHECERWVSALEREAEKGFPPRDLVVFRPTR